MKSFHLRTLETILRYMSIVVLKRHKPIIVGITGSVGKSSTKEAIAIVLGTQFRIRHNTGNLNNEIGTALTIIGASSGGSSIARWCIVVIRWMITLLSPRKSYPEILILELGIDRVGDMNYFLSFLSPTVGVLTAISTSHLEFFKNISTIAREKGKLILSVPKDGAVILNANEPHVMKFQEKVKSQVFSYGFKENAIVRATNIAFFNDKCGKPIGSSFKLEYEGKSIPVRLPNIIAEHHILAALAAASVGIFFKMNPLDVAQALENFQSLPGRMRLLEGVRRSLVIDDSYNSSPKSLEAALQTLGNLGGIRRFVVLGDMLELGNESDEAHQKVAEWIQECDISDVFLMGKRMLLAKEELERRGFSKEHIHWFTDPDTIGNELAATLREGDIVLVKGSQCMRLEKAVEVVMMHSSDARNLLCRQSAEWLRTPFVQEIN